LQPKSGKRTHFFAPGRKGVAPGGDHDMATARKRAVLRCGWVSAIVRAPEGFSGCRT
jgi:hypothetical protein